MTSRQALAVCLPSCSTRPSYLKLTSKEELSPHMCLNTAAKCSLLVPGRLALFFACSSLKVQAVYIQDGTLFRPVLTGPAARFYAQTSSNAQLINNAQMCKALL